MGSIAIKFISILDGDHQERLVPKIVQEDLILMQNLCVTVEGYHFRFSPEGRNDKPGWYRCHLFREIAIGSPGSGPHYGNPLCVSGYVGDSSPMIDKTVFQPSPFISTTNLAFDARVNNFDTDRWCLNIGWRSLLGVECSNMVLPFERGQQEKANYPEKNKPRSKYLVVAFAVPSANGPCEENASPKYGEPQFSKRHELTPHDSLGLAFSWQAPDSAVFGELF
ncbi:MAG: hypothetical protein ACLPIX_21310 [Rhodomicrobium sp.]